jgi:hypothetical protein
MKVLIHIHTFYCFIFPAETSVDGHKLPTQYASLATSENSSIDDFSETSPVPASLIAQFFLLYFRNIMVLCRSYVSKQRVHVRMCVCVVLCYHCCIHEPRPMAENLV